MPRSDDRRRPPAGGQGRPRKPSSAPSGAGRGEGPRGKPPRKRPAGGKPAQGKFARDDRPPRAAKRPTRPPAKPAPARATTSDASAAAPPPRTDRTERLQKVMASAGLGSRRECEELISEGRVEVDRQVVTELGARVDPDKQEVRVDGVSLRRSKLVYYIVNKPPGVVSTTRDPSGRPRVIDLVPERDKRLFTVGRLDLSSGGLMLVTNDGDLANRLAHPRYGVKKVYHALVAGVPSREVLDRLRRGIRLAEAYVRVENVRVVKSVKQSTLLEIVLAEGINREIRRIMARVGHKVMRLTRVALGPLKLASLQPGAWRRLSGEEIDALRYAARHEGAPPRRRARPLGSRIRREKPS